MTPTTLTAPSDPRTLALSHPRTYSLDLAHSEVAFQVRHLLTKLRGRFTDFAGTIEFDEAHPELSSITVTIRAASIDTAQPDRDKHLRSDDFFGVDQFPELRFVSTGMTRSGPDSFDVAGTMTIRGVSKPVVVPVTALGKARDPWGTEKLGFEAEFKLNRKDYGLNWNAVVETGGFVVGDEIKVSLSFQAAADKQQ